jgi:hypothetical protein
MVKVTKESETPTGYCQCGRPLHYSSASKREQVERIVSATDRPFQTIKIGEKAYRVQKHFVALHGFNARMAEDYGFEQVTPERKNNDPIKRS